MMYVQYIAIAAVEHLTSTNILSQRLFLSRVLAGPSVERKREREREGGRGREREGGTKEVSE